MKSITETNSFAHPYFGGFIIFYNETYYGNDAGESDVKRVENRH